MKGAKQEAEEEKRRGYLSGTNGFLSPPLRVCKRTQAYKRTHSTFAGVFELSKRTAKRASVRQSVQAYLGELKG